MDRLEMVNALNDLLTRNHDAKEEYVEAGNGVNDRMLRQWLFDNSEKRTLYINEIQNQITILGGTPDHGSSFLGALHRAWIDFKSNIADGDVVVLEECIRGEERAMEDYDKVLQEVKMTNEITNVIRRQRRNIQDSLNALRAIEETFKVAQ